MGRAASREQKPSGDGGGGGSGSSSGRPAPAPASAFASSASASASAPSAPPPPPPPPPVFFRHAAYADVNEAWRDTAADRGSLYPKHPSECGPIVVPVLISRSHSIPYLEALRHLAARGYRVVALVDCRNAEWVRRAYGGGGGGGGAFEIETIPEALTAPVWAQFDRKVGEVAERGDDPAALAATIGDLGAKFARALFAFFKERAAQLEPSLFVIDVFYGFAADVCDELSIPYVATTSGLIPGTADCPRWTRPLYTTDGEPTTKNMSLFSRLKEATVEPARLALAAWPALCEGAAVRKELGVTAPRAGCAAPSERFKHRLTLVNTFFGHESPRPLPPYVRLIGPVRNQGAASTPLEGEFKAFVDRRGGDEGRLVLLSFGQNCALTPPRLRAILGGLKRLLARKVIDGAVWSVSMTPEPWLAEAGFREPGAVPDDVLVVPWCPQQRLLESPAVRAFVSHGGAESCGEGFASASPMLLIPHFSDQPRNSVLIAEAGAGLVLSKRALTAEGVEGALERLVSDPSFARGARRMRALAAACGRLSTERAADEVEFVLQYGSDAHLRPAGDDMGWLRRHDADLCLAVLGSVGLVAGVVGLAAGAVAARRRR